MKNKIINRPVQLKSVSFDELYEEISTDWQDRGRRLQARRWHMLRRRMSGEAKKKHSAHFRTSLIRT